MGAPRILYMEMTGRKLIRVVAVTLVVTALAAASALAGGFHSSAGGIDATDFVWEEREGRFLFRFEVVDATVHAVSDVKTKRDLERGDRVELFFSPTQGMDKWYYCAEIDPRGRVLDYRATYHRRFDYAWSFKTLECRAVRTEKGYRVEGSVALDELRSLGLDISDFWLGAFRADYDSEERLVAWFSLLPPGPGEPDFHRPCMLFRLTSLRARFGTRGKVGIRRGDH